MQTKRCSKCLKRMSVNKFYACVNSTDGLRGSCKECRKKATNKNYKKKINRIVIKEVKIPCIESIINKELEQRVNAITKVAIMFLGTTVIATGVAIYFYMVG